MKTIGWLALSACIVGCGGNAAPTGAPADNSDAEPEAASDTAPPPPPPMPQMLSISEVAFFQAPKVDLAIDGARVDARNAPVIAGRPGLLRVYVMPAEGWKSHALVGELHLRVGGKDLPGLTDTKAIAVASKDSDLKTTFDFDVPPEAVAIDTTYAIAIHPERPLATADEGVARYPADGSEALGAVAGAEQIRVQIVPVRYDADSSARTPNITAAQIENYRSTLFAMYPVAKVEITMHAPMPLATAVQADGTGWDDLVQAVIDLRAKDAAPDDVYYVAAVEPERSLMKFCGGGCVLGVAPQIGLSAIDQRVAAITGYPDDEAVATLSQELAHAMGRGHAPCGNPKAIDRKFPYADGSTGGFGYDVVGHQLIDPSDGWYDFMSYCQPTWVSDYTFAGLYTRIAAVNAATKKAMTHSAIDAPRPYRLVHVNADGSMRWGRTVTMRHAPEGELVTASFTNDDGVVVSRGGAQYFPYDHIGGGLLVASDPAASFDTLRVDAPFVRSTLRAER